jgi:C1A family cysteine protease
MLKFIAPFTMKKTFLTLTLLLAFTLTTQAQYSRGCLKEKSDTSLTLKKNFPREILPSSFSLKQYAPEAKSQGSLSSCTAWSSAYAGLTIVRRIEEKNFGLEAYSALSLYNRMKSMTSEDPCNAGGCYVSEALTMLKEHGCPQMSETSNACGYASASGYFTDKLYGFDEIGVTTTNIKSALTKNAPVVIVIQYYYDSWGDEKNLKNGIWNGHYGAADGYHAMCIVGYDDEVGTAGAFQVMNSWGNDWGDQGFFWLEYKDLFHLDQAFMLLPNPNMGTNDNTTDNNNNSNNGPLEKQSFRVYNECSVTAYVALSQYNQDSWVNRGWYAVQPGRYIDLNILNREQDDIYWMAVNNANSLVWCDNQNGTDMCYDPVDAFTIYDNANPSCPKYKKFFKESPGFEYEVYNQTLTCPSIKSRGNTTAVLTTGVLDFKQDKRPMDEANLHWVKGSLLIDVYTQSMIHATTNQKGEAVYAIWYVDANNTVLSGNFTEDELTNLKAYKFETQDNAQKWISLR